MPVVVEKWVTDPLAVVRQLFETSSGGGAGDWGVRQYFDEKLRTDAGRAAVPLLTSASVDCLHNGCLVRYRGMVQDQLGTEFFLKKYHATINHQDKVCCGLYSDLAELPMDVGEVNWDHTSNVMADRATLYCVPVPAQTPWTKKMWEEPEDRQLGPTDGSEVTPTSGSETTPTNGGDTMATSTRMKRLLEGDEECMETEGGQVEGTGKKHCPLPSGHHGNSSTIALPNLNFPLPEETGTPCLVKVYGEWEELHVCSVVEMVGVLSMHPALGEGVEERAHSPPPSLVPRLHAITMTTLHHYNPLLPPTLPSLSPGREQILGARGVLLEALSGALCGDRLAAEYLLLHLLSSVYGRSGTMALGKFSLNLTRCQDNQLIQEIYQLLTRCLTKCLLLALSLEKLNSSSFAPKKDYDSNRLLAGTLQLSAGTEVVVDETALSVGQLTEVGVANITALGNVIQWQKLPYNFQFHNTEFDTDLPVLIVSEGRSMIKVDCQVPVLASGPSTRLDLSESQLDLVRQYLTLCQKLQYSLAPPMQQVIEEEFVSQRRGSEGGMSGDRLHQLLCVGRLVAISHGATSLGPQHWTHTKALEESRLARL